MRIELERFGKIRLVLPASGALPIVGMLILSFQPMGSFVSLFLFVGLVILMAWRERIPAKPVSNWAVILAVYLAILLVIWSMRPENVLLFLLYSGYLTFLLLFGLMSGRAILGMSEEDRQNTILFILILDLAINLPSTLIELALHGAGDPIQGFAGLILTGNFSQGRTNAVRAGLLLSMAMFLHGRRKGFIPAASAGFNAIVLILGTSMTALLSAFAAGATALLLTKQSYRALKLSAIVLLAALGALMNQLLYHVSLAGYLLALDYHFTFTPKLNIYPHLLTTVIPQRPLSVFFGNGLGNFMNRFVVLANFEHYSKMPFKSVLMTIFNSEDARTHLVDQYNLEAGVQGNSIVGVPWNGMLALFLETGLLGLLFFLALLGRYFMRVFRAGKGLMGSGVFLIAFFCFNTCFDNYFDYPEVACLFLIAASLFAATVNEPAGAPGPVHLSPAV